MNTLVCYEHSGAAQSVLVRLLHPSGPCSRELAPLHPVAACVVDEPHRYGINFGPLIRLLRYVLIPLSRTAACRRPPGNGNLIPDHTSGFFSIPLMFRLIGISFMFGNTVRRQQLKVNKQHLYLQYISHLLTL